MCAGQTNQLQARTWYLELGFEHLDIAGTQLKKTVLETQSMSPREMYSLEEPRGYMGPKASKGCKL